MQTASLSEGYVIETHVLRRNGQTIGITYARHPRSRTVILYCGGSAFHRSLEGAIPLQTLARGADVALFDYPGYGESTGQPNAEAVLDAAVAAYDHVFSLDAARGKKRVLYGFSLGGMVVAQLALDRHADAVILEATAHTVSGWARSRIPVWARPLVRVRVEPQIATLDTAAALDHFPGRIAVLASRADRVVPISQSFEIVRRLERTRRDVRLLEFDGRRHGDIMGDLAFSARLSDFLDRVGRAP